MLLRHEPRRRGRRLVLLSVHAPHPGRALEDFLAENRAGTQTMLMHRAVWEAVRSTRPSAAIRTGTLPSGRPSASGSCTSPEALVESEVGGDSISAVVKSYYPHLLRLYEKHAALYQRFPRSDAVMNRRLGKRSHRLIRRAPLRTSAKVSGSATIPMT